MDKPMSVQICEELQKGDNTALHIADVLKLSRQSVSSSIGLLMQQGCLVHGTPIKQEIIRFGYKRTVPVRVYHFVRMPVMGGPKKQREAKRYKGIPAGKCISRQYRWGMSPV